MFKKSIDETIAGRYSCRSFDGKAVNPEDRAAMENFLAHEATDHQGKRVNLRLVENGSASEKARKLGTYGMISGTSLFLAGSIPGKNTESEGFGFAFEKAILYAAEIGLGSCWLAGTLDRKAFSLSMGLNDDDLIPAVSPLGYPAARPKLRDSLSRTIVRSRTRKDPAELFFAEDGMAPLPEEAARRYAAPLEALRRAPSARNLQPWRLSRTRGGFRFFAKRAPGNKSVFGFDLQAMDLGIAMCHFQLSALAAGLNGRWENEKDSGSGPSGSEYLVSWIDA
jgi:hypothetical protein